jgi:hypothetical protein
VILFSWFYLDNRFCVGNPALGELTTEQSPSTQAQLDLLQGFETPVGTLGSPQIVEMPIKFQYTDAANRETNE